MQTAAVLVLEDCGCFFGTIVNSAAQYCQEQELPTPTANITKANKIPHNPSDANAKKEGKRMKRFRKFLNDLREPLGIGMKRLMIALTIILGIVIVTAAGWLLWSRIGMAYARNKVSDTYLQNQPAYQSFVADRDDYAYRVRYTTFYTPSDALTEMGVEKIYEEVGSCICFEQAWRALGGIPQGILYAPDTEEVPSWYHRVQLDNDWYYYWIPG